jgi:hypothetical protein
LQHRRIASYAETMTRSGVLVQAEWSEGEEIDVQHQMTGMTRASWAKRSSTPMWLGG